LDLPPVGLRFVSEAPAGVPEVGRDFPSSCSFWREAEHRTFYASAQRHEHCAVGAMVMGFQLPEEVTKRLGEVVSAMTECGYLSPEEAASIPTIAEPYAGVVYGPLAEATEPVDIVLVWVTAKQAMLCGESVGSAAWTAQPTTVTGRPACAALPRAMSSGAPAMSIGCIGMRTFTEIADDRILLTVPAAGLERFVVAVERITAANEAMLRIYREMRDNYAGAR